MVACWTARLDLPLAAHSGNALSARRPALPAVLVNVAQRLEDHVMLPPYVVAGRGRISFVIPAILAGFEVAA